MSDLLMALNHPLLFNHCIRISDHVEIKCATDQGYYFAATAENRCIVSKSVTRKVFYRCRHRHRRWSVRLASREAIIGMGEVGVGSYSNRGGNKGLSMFKAMEN